VVWTFHYSNLLILNRPHDAALAQIKRVLRITWVGKRYNQEFKADITRLINQDGRSVASIVMDFGVSEQTVRNWLKETKDSKDPDKVRIAELETELKANDKRLADHEMTIEILKKATTIFAQSNQKYFFKLSKRIAPNFRLRRCARYWMCQGVDITIGDKRTPSKREQENGSILEIMIKSHTKAQGMIGLDKLWGDVKDDGFQCGRNRVSVLSRKGHNYLIALSSSKRVRAVESISKCL
jgi:transposase-like protein